MILLLLLPTHFFLVLSQEESSDEQSHCSHLSNPLYGQVMVYGSGYNSFAVYTCNPKYQLVGLPGRVCNEDYEWTGEEPICEGLHDYPCGVLSPPDNGYLDITGEGCGAVATYSCHTGFKLDGYPQLVCETDGHWSLIPPNCTASGVIGYCGHLSNPLNGIVAVSDFDGDRMAVYNCNTGYKLKGSYFRECTKDYKWSGKVPVCEKYGSSSSNDQLECDLLNDPENGQVAVMGTSVGSIATYKCDAGYMLNGYANRICDDYQRWSGFAPVCVPSDDSKCGSPPRIENGEVSVEEGVAKYTCNSGYKMEGLSVMTCGSDRLWSSLAPYCRDSDEYFFPCPTLSNPLNGIVSISGYQPNSVASYQCNIGFTLTGYPKRVCKYGGKWTSNPPLCKSSGATYSCGRPQNPKNGGVHVVNNNSAVTAIYSCKTGFYLQGRSRIECRSAGWAVSPPTCEALPSKCKRSSAPEHGSVKIGERVSSTMVATYTCALGYTLVGSQYRFCSATIGVWSSKVPQCRISQVEHEHSPVDTSSSSMSLIIFCFLCKTMFS